jgi:Domain of unknown function (DUF4157)
MHQLKAIKSKPSSQPGARQDARPLVAPVSEQDRWMELQRGIGNQAVSRMLHRRAAPGGADAAAKVSIGDAQTGTVPPSVCRALTSPGAPLEPGLRQEMEQRLGYDFSSVRVHSGEAADQSARNLNARAYTVGHNIVFSHGRFSPTTMSGRQLLAHELAHVLQQDKGAGATSAMGAALLTNSLSKAANRTTPQARSANSSTAELDIGRGDITAELEANRVSDAILTGAPVKVSAAPVGIYCAPEDAPPKPKVRYENESLEDIFIDITEDYNDILFQQRDGVDRVEKAVAHIRPPKEERSFWAFAAELALTAACFAVGRIVEEYAIQKLEHSKVEEKVAAAVGEGLKEFTAEGVKEKVKTAAKAVSSEDGRDIFFDAQKEALNNQAHEGKRQFNHEGKQKILKSKDPLTQARVLRDAMDEAYSRAKEETKNLEIDRWASTLAQSELGTRFVPSKQLGAAPERVTDLTPVLSAKGVGTTIEEEEFGMTKEKGVLTIKVESEEPAKPVKVKSMEIHGLSPEFVNLLNGRKIKDVKLPVVVLTRDLPRLFTQYEGGVLKIGRDEMGKVVLGSHLSANTAFYLTWRAIAVGWSKRKLSDIRLGERADLTDADVLLGAKAIFDIDLAETPVNLKGGD